MLFVGDGKQHVIDLLGSIFAISAYYYAYTHNKTTHIIPKYIHAFWIAYIGISVLSSIFSISPAYSFTALVRLSIAYLLYDIFFRYSHAGDTQTFMKWLAVFTVVSIILSMGLLLNSNFIFISSMNLLYPTYGHNHLANILLFALPTFFHTLISDKSRKNFILFIIFSIGLLATFSRGALFIAGMYILFQTGIFWKKLKFQYRLALAILGFAFIQSLLVFSYISKNPTHTANDTSIFRLAAKTSLKLDSRIEYWGQAVSGFFRSPLVGNGPGTFFLISKQYQKVPKNYSWFAHNLPLETLAETGLIGFLILFTFIGLLVLSHRKNALFSQEKTQAESARTVIFHGIVLTIMYSLIEFNLNYLLLWMLFWTATGLIFPVPKIHNSDKKQIPWLSKITIAFLLYFYVSSLITLIIPKDVLKHSKVLIYVTPYSVYGVNTYIDNIPDESTLSVFDLALIEKFHTEDPEIHGHLARYFEMRGDKDRADYYFQQTLLRDPQNFQEHNNYFKFLLSSDGNSEKIIKHLQRLDSIHASENDQQILSSFHTSKYAARLFTKENLTENSSTPDYYVNLYHRMGLSLLPFDSDAVKQIWEIMYRMYPGWSYFYIDFAGLMKYRYNDTAFAEKILRTCQQEKDAGRHCKEFTIETLPTHSILRPDVPLSAL